MKIIMAPALSRAHENQATNQQTLKIGKTVFHVLCSFNGKVRYSEVLEKIIERKMRQSLDK